MPNKAEHWSDDRVEQMKLLIADHSYGMAASIMGYPFTRSSLISKAKRLGLTTPKGEKRSYPRHHAQTCPVTSGNSRKSKRRPTPPPSDILPPVGERATIPGGALCRFPYGDTSGPDWVMCAHPVWAEGHPYCAGHHRLTHVPVPVEQQAEAA